MSGDYSRLYRLIEKRTAKVGIIGLGRALGHRARTCVRERFSIERMLDSTNEKVMQTTGLFVPRINDAGNL